MAAHGNAAITRQALDHLFSSAKGNYELILVDDASPDDTIGAFLNARRFKKRLKIFRFPTNLEYCESVNAILSHASGEFIFFVSNDVFVTPAYLGELVSCLRDNPAFGIARGCSNFVDGNLQPHNLIDSKSRFESKVELFKFAEALQRANVGTLPLDDPYLTGDSFAVHRRVLDEIGGIDIRFIGYFGDVDFAIRSRAAGFRNVITTRAFAYHNVESNLNYLSSEERARKIERRFQRVNAAYLQFLAKYALGEGSAEGGIGPLDRQLFLQAIALATEKAKRDSPLIASPRKDYSQYLVG